MIIVTRATVIKRLRQSSRALLLCELAPSRSAEALTATLATLRELEARSLVSLNPQTDRWAYIGPRVEA